MLQVFLLHTVRLFKDYSTGVLHYRRLFLSSRPDNESLLPHLSIHPRKVCVEVFRELLWSWRRKLKAGRLQGKLTPSPSAHPAVGTHLLPLLWVGLAAAWQPCVRHEGMLTGRSDRRAGYFNVGGLSRHDIPGSGVSCAMRTTLPGGQSCTRV